MTLCYPPFIGRLAFAAVDGELHSNSSGFILFFRNNRVGFGGQLLYRICYSKTKKRRAICPQPLELPFPAIHSLFVFFPVGLRKFFRRLAIQAMVSAKSITASAISSIKWRRNSPACTNWSRLFNASTTKFQPTEVSYMGKPSLVGAVAAAITSCF